MISAIRRWPCSRRCRADRVAAAHHDRRTLPLETARLPAEGAQVGRVLDRAAGQDDGGNALTAQHLQVAQLTVRLAERVAEDDQRSVGRRHLLDAGHDLGEVGIGDVVNDDADHVGGRAAQRLRVRVPHIAEIVHGPLHAGARQLGNGIASVEHA